MPEIRLRRQVRLVYRKGGERAHASAAFLGLIESSRKKRDRSPVPDQNPVT
jgi:hypothetical protein